MPLPPVEPHRELGPYSTPELNDEKLKAAVHYICATAPNPNTLGATKLNKILFYADMQAYLDRGRPITGEVYIKKRHGPVSTHVNDVVSELENEDALAVSEITRYLVYTDEQYTQRIYFSLMQPNVSVFDGEEMQILDRMVDVICKRHTASSISKRSHNIVWKLAEIGEEIPYYTVCANLLRAPDAYARNWALGRIASARNAAA